MKRALVTGGSGLIGAGICTRLSAEGWEVASFDIAPPADLPDPPGPPTFRHITCDVTDEGAIAAAFGQLDWGGFDLLVHCAGRADPVTGPLADLSLSDWRAMVDSHLTATFLMTRAALPLLRDGGVIIPVASTRALQSEPETEAYAAAKGGIIALTHALAVSLGPRLRVNCIAPGWIAAPAGLRPEDHAQHPVGRVGTPADIAEAVLYLAGAGFMTGQVLTLDGGMTRKMIYAP